MPKKPPYRTTGAGAKLTRAQREERAQKMQQQANRGWSQWRIARYHGVLQGTVSKILKRNLELYLKPLTAEEVQTFVAQQREHYRQVREDANRSYLRSLKDSEKEEWERVMNKNEDYEMVLAKRVKEGQDGNAAFLNVILKAIRDESELLGVVKNNVTVNNSNTVSTEPTITWQEMMARIEEARACKAVEERMSLDLPL